MTEIADGRRAEIDGQSHLRLTELDRDWALRRLEMFKALDGSVQQTISNVLEVAGQVTKAASELRHEMEGEADALVGLLRREREAILQEIQASRRQRDDVVGEMADLRRRTEEEALRVRREAEEVSARLRREAEDEAANTRRSADEAAARLRQQTEEETGRARREVEAEIADLRRHADEEIARQRREA